MPPPLSRSSRTLRKRRAPDQSSLPVEPAKLPEVAAAWWAELSVWQVAVFLALICSCLYGWTLGFPMVFDDDVYLRNNPLFTDPKLFSWFTDLPGLVKRGEAWGLNADLATNLILRPVAYASFRLNYELSGFGPESYRLINVAIHIGNATLIFAIVGQLLRQRSSRESRQFIALAAAVLFAVHPMAIESVTYIAQRFTSLATLFYLTALWLHFESNDEASRRRRKWLIGGAVTAMLLGMMTKECTVTAPVMAVFLDMVVRQTPWKAAVRRGLPLLLCLPVVPGLVLLTTWAQHSGDWSLRDAIYLANSKEEPMSHWHYVLSQCSVVASYLRRLFVPTGLNLDPAWPLSTSIFEWPVLRSILVFAGMLGLSVWGWRRFKDDARMACIAACVVWFFATISISSGLVPLPDLMAEHRAYLPSIGIFIAFGCLMDWVRERWTTSPERQRHAVMMVAGLAAILATLTCQRNQVWSSSVKLWEDTVAKSPDSFRPLANLAYQYHLAGQYVKAVETYHRLLEVKPDFELGHIYLASTLNQMKSHRQAVRVCEEFLARKPSANGTIMIQGTLAAAYVGLGRIDDGVRVLKRSADAMPDQPGPHMALSSIFEATGAKDLAASHVRKALALNPKPHEALVLRDRLSRVTAGANP